jgi:hypothetical protein
MHRGQIVIHRDVKKDVLEIFKLIEEKSFPVHKAVPIVRYDWSDDRSMADNNTSAFNYRVVQGTERLSNHDSGKR